MKYLFGLISCFILGLYLRTLFLPQKSLTFGYDQARDAYISLQIANGDLKILGPSASTPGLYHGVFYYYLIAPVYKIAHGSPIAVAYWIVFLNTMGVFLVFGLVHLMTKKPAPALIAALMFAVSFEASQYAVWLSNPTIAIWTIPIMYLGLWLWTKENYKWGSIICGLGLGLSIQAEIFLAYHLVPMGIWLFWHPNKLQKTDLVKFSSAFLLTVSTMLAVEMKFGFRSLGGIYHLLTNADTIVSARGLGDLIILYFNQLGKVFAYSTYPTNVGYGGALVLGLLIWGWFKKGQEAFKFLTLWLFSHLTVVSVGGTSTPFLLVGFAPAISILLGISFYHLKRPIGAILIAAVVLANISMIVKENYKGQTIFAIQKDMLLSKQLAAIDHTYSQAAGKPFSLNTLTSPLWINIVWTYLYKWYGLPKYGYLPQWHGRDQIGQLDSLSSTDKSTKLYFLIIEPMDGIPPRYLPETIGEEDSLSRLVEEKEFGAIRVQERLRL